MTRYCFPYGSKFAHNPYFPYDQELFGHDKDNTPDLQENWYYLSGLHKGRKCYNIHLQVKFHYGFPPLMMVFWKEDSPCFPRLLVTSRLLLANFYCSLSLYCSLFTFTVHSTIHFEFCQFKGGCPLRLNKFLLQNFLSLGLLPLEAFFERKFLVPITTISLQSL